MSVIALLNCHGDDVFCFRKEIIDALVNKGFKVLLSCPDSSRLDIFRNNENILIEDISIDRRGTNPFKDLKLLIDYIKLFKKHRPDVVCNFTIKPNIYGSIAADIMRIPHINNITGLGSGFQNGGFVQKVVKLLYKFALRKSKKVFFQNAENQYIALNVGLINNETPHEIIPGSGVNLDRFEYKPIDQNKNEIVFNYIGRVLKDKRVDDFIDAAKIIKSKYSNVRFNIIGFIEPTEIHYKNLLKTLEDNGIIHYLGSVDDVRSLVYASDAIIHPSSYGEGISNVLLESAACGRAIITTDIAGCKDCVDDNVTGYVYHAEDVSQLVSKIDSFLHLSNEQRIKMGLQGRLKVEKQFDRRIVVDKYLKEVGV
ncbi:galacturonosyl transferase [Bacteroides pyogenes JCM 6292]|uniref:Galacturonosyl transferase n=2 Tax=Bacteroides pyogenes TaxID=310300 RepID=W4PL18_9BACE|nr:glycosyltransferase family 4 protein [Bacteroides pyogenes]GAE15808.1 galacturonosyl transferase [Bacteroides pyogenes JCM 6292]GAE20506.1 galacturonosyl transferase [Bacteroides pyogenes DSM 20611 = JCM 6294]